MFLLRKNGATSNILRVMLRNSSTGAGLTGLTSSSAGLIISTLADKEAAATAYTQAGSTIETIATLGTFAAPTSTKVRFKEVDATNHPGLYEIQIADARFAVSGAQTLRVTISGAANLITKDCVLQLTSVDVDDATAFGLSRLDAAISSRSTYAGTDTSGTTTLLARVTGAVPLAADYTTARAAKLDNLDAAISTRSTYAGADTSGTTTLLARLTSTRAGLLDNLSNLDATISGIAAAVWAAATRTLTAFSDSSGITTLLSRVTGAVPLAADYTTARAAKLDNLDATVSSRSSHSAADIWAVTTRTLSSYGTLVADIATAVWAAVTRTLTAVSDSSGITTLLARLTSTRAGLLDNLSRLDVAVSTRAEATAASTGAYLVTVTVTDNHGAPLENALVRVTEGINSFTAVTNPSGVATFNLDPATYALAITKAGYQFTPDAIVVTAAANFDQAMAQVAIAAPADPDQTTGFITTRDGHGAPLADVSIFFQLQSSTVADSFSSAEFEAVSDSTGLLTVALVKGARYRAKRAYQFKLTEPETRWVTFVASASQGSFALPQILGTP